MPPTGDQVFKHTSLWSSIQTQYYAVSLSVTEAEELEPQEPLPRFTLPEAPGIQVEQAECLHLGLTKGDSI